MGTARSWPSTWPTGKVARPGRTSCSDCAAAPSTASSSSSPTITPAFVQPSAMVLPEAAVQPCYVHFLRNALDHLPRKADDDCLQELRWLYDRRNVEEARRDLAAWIVRWGDRYRKLVDWVEETIEETFTFYRLPRQHHKHLKSTNMLERLNEEIKRRTHVVRIFPNAEACLRLVRALAVETHENWLEAHRYLNMNDLREHKKTHLRKAA